MLGLWMVAEDHAKVKFDFLDIEGALVLIDQGSLP